MMTADRALVLIACPQRNALACAPVSRLMKSPPADGVWIVSVICVLLCGARSGSCHVSVLPFCVTLPDAAINVTPAASVSVRTIDRSVLASSSGSNAANESASCSLVAPGGASGRRVTGRLLLNVKTTSSVPAVYWLCTRAMLNDCARGDG